MKALILAVLLLVPQLVEAGPRIGERVTLVPMQGASRVLVFRNLDAMKEVFALVKAGASDALMLRYVSCYIPGTQAITAVIVEPGGQGPWSAVNKDRQSAYTVLIVSGPYEGCRGIVLQQSIE